MHRAPTLLEHAMNCWLAGYSFTDFSEVKSFQVCKLSAREKIINTWSAAEYSFDYVCTGYGLYRDDPLIENLKKPPVRKQA